VPEEWIVQTRISGAFYVESSSFLAAAPFLGLKTFTLRPTETAEGKLDGNHILEFTLELANDDSAELQHREVFNRCKDYVSNLLARLAIGIGREVIIIGGISAKRYSPSDPKKWVALLGATGVHLTPPALLPVSVLTSATDPGVERAAHWWARAMSIRDPVDRLKALTVALDLIASSIEIPVTRQRECRNCGFTEDLKPGLREKTVAFLAEENGVDPELAKCIYASRNALTHGGEDLTSDRLQQYRRHCGVVAKAVRDGIARRMNVALSPRPTGDFIDIDASFLTFHYTKN